VKCFEMLELVEVFPHLPYSPDLAPSGFHLLWPVKDYVCGCHFRLAEEVKEIFDWLPQQSIGILS
jgi:hypothetical protein